MRLADFIHSNVEPILVEWEAFARGIAPGAISVKSVFSDTVLFFRLPVDVDVPAGRGGTARQPRKGAAGRQAGCKPLKMLAQPRHVSSMAAPPVTQISGHRLKTSSSCVSAPGPRRR